jgi:hypothetical protein
VAASPPTAVTRPRRRRWNASGPSSQTITPAPPLLPQYWLSKNNIRNGRIRVVESRLPRPALARLRTRVIIEGGLGPRRPWTEVERRLHATIDSLFLPFTFFLALLLHFVMERRSPLLTFALSLSLSSSSSLSLFLSRPAYLSPRTAKIPCTLELRRRRRRRRRVFLSLPRVEEGREKVQGAKAKYEGERGGKPSPRRWRRAR